MRRTTKRHRTRDVIAAAALAVPSVVFASSPKPALLEQKAPETRPGPDSASAYDQRAPVKGALLRAVAEALASHGQQEASPFEPPGKPPGRPPDRPGHHGPPNPPGQPPDRPPERPGH
jgi:hypothetical protein